LHSIKGHSGPGSWRSVLTPGTEFPIPLESFSLQRPADSPRERHPSRHPAFRVLANVPRCSRFSSPFSRPGQRSSQLLSPAPTTRALHSLEPLQRRRRRRKEFEKVSHFFSRPSSHLSFHYQDLCDANAPHIMLVVFLPLVFFLVKIARLPPLFFFFPVRTYFSPTELPVGNRLPRNG